MKIEDLRSLVELGFVKTRTLQGAYGRRGGAEGMRRNKKEFLPQMRQVLRKKPGELALRRALSLSDD